jgi:hypothetical protein
VLRLLVHGEGQQSHSVHDISKVKRELTKRNSLVEKSSKTSVHLDLLPRDASVKFGKVSLKCNNTKSSKAQICHLHVTACQVEDTAPVSSTCNDLVSKSCNQNSVFNWLHSTSESRNVMMCKSDAASDQDCDVKSAVVSPQTCNKFSSCSLQNSSCSCLKSKACNMCKIHSVKTSPDSCSNSNASLTPSSSSSNSSKTALVSSRRLNVSSSDCPKRRSRRLNRGLQMPESPAVSDSELKDQSVELNKVLNATSDAKILVPDRPRRSVTMKKAVR